VTQGRPRDRVILTALRLAVLGVVLFCLFRPTLVVRAAVNQQNVVAVLLDDSSSMQIPDAGGKTRGQWVQDEFGAPTAPLLKSLGDRFLVRVFAFPPRPRASSRPRLTFKGRRPSSAPRSTASAKSWPGCRWPAWSVTDGADTSEASLSRRCSG
jgi:hypothetical protein